MLSSQKCNVTNHGFALEIPDLLPGYFFKSYVGYVSFALTLWHGIKAAGCSSESFMQGH